MSGEHILIIDDSEEITSFVIAILQPMGFQISYAEDGRDGLAKALYGKPDLVLLDLNLPGMSGISVLEALHQRQIQIPVIMMTFHGSESVVARALRLGVKDYIIKPFQVDTLVSSVERVLGMEGEQQHAQQVLAVEEPEPAPQTQAPRPQGTSAKFEALLRDLAMSESQMDLLRQITEGLLNFAGADVAAVFLLSGTKGLVTAAMRHQSDYRADLRIKDRHAEEALQAGKPMWISAPLSPPSFAAHFGQAEHVLYIPLQSRRRVVGMLGVAYFQAYTGEQSELVACLAALAHYVALLQENLHLRDGERKSASPHAFAAVLTLLARYVVVPVQELWKLIPDIRAVSGDAQTAAQFEIELKRIAVVLSFCKELASPQSKFYFASASSEEIERVLRARLASVKSRDVRK